MSREGDVSHALIVLAFDLTQRAIKAKLNEDSDIALVPYEKRMFLSVKELVTKTIQDTARSKTEELIGQAGIPKTTLARVRFVHTIYGFLIGNVKPFVEELLKDPKKIRRYFSFSGIWRIVADFTSAGYQQALLEELKSELSERGLLVSRTRRVFFARLIFVIGLVASGTAMYLCYDKGGGWGVGLCLFVSSAFTAWLIKVELSLRSLIPLYTETAQVLADVKRSGWRIKLFRNLLSIVRVFITATVLLTAFLSASITQTLLAWAIPALHDLQFGFCLALILLNYVGVSAILLSVFLPDSEVATQLARDQIAERKRELLHLSPISTFKETLESPTQDNRFSYLLALYGHELLLLFA